MVEINKVNGKEIVNYNARDYDSLLRAMRELIPHKLPDWKTYESEADFGNVLLQLFAHMGDILSYYQDRVANESFLGTAQTRRSIIHHLRLIGYRLATAAPASTILTVSVPDSKNDVLNITRGSAFATKSQKNASSVRFEYNGSDLTIDLSKSDSGLWTHQNGKKSFVLPVEEGRLILKEKLGISDGAPNQRFVLLHQGLILRSPGLVSKASSEIEVTVYPESEENSTTPWTLQESLAFSREEQQDYTVEIDDNDVATVVFGDGAFGAIPPSGYAIFATYRVGGGLKGNVPAGTIQTIVNAPQLSLLGATVTNAGAATGGSDREVIEHAVRQAPAVFRSLKRAVTGQDFKALALMYPGVGKVKAEALNWNQVVLYVAPEGGGYVSDVLKKNLLAYFEDKRPVTTIIDIQDVNYVPIFIQATVGVERYYMPEDVIDKVRSAVSNILSFDNVDFNQTIYLSTFYKAIEAVEGVQYVTITEFRTGQFPNGYPVQGSANELVKPDGKIELGAYELPVIPDDPDYQSGINIITDTGMNKS